MNAFEHQQAQLAAWINSDPNRQVDWDKLSGGLTVERYCTKFAYKERIADEIVRVLMLAETDRVLDFIYYAG